MAIDSHSDAHSGSHGNVSFHFLLTYACLHAFWLHFFSLGSFHFYDWLAKLISYSVLCLRRSDIPSTAIKQRGRIDGQERDAETLRIQMFCPPLNWSNACGWANVFSVIHIWAPYRYIQQVFLGNLEVWSITFWGRAFQPYYNLLYEIFVRENSISSPTKQGCREV